MAMNVLRDLILIRARNLNTALLKIPVVLRDLILIRARNASNELIVMITSIKRPDFDKG